MRGFRHIVLALLVLVAVGSCRGPRRISRSDMMDIYHDMFLLDQQVRTDMQFRRHADTMLVYESVFNQYGYNTDDYLYSVEYYLMDPERFAKMLSEVSDRLKKEGQEVERQITLVEWREGMMKLYGMPADTTLPRQRDTLFTDTLFIGRDRSKAVFFSFIKAERVDTLSIPFDTLRMAADTLLEPLDTLPAPPDSLKGKER